MNHSSQKVVLAAMSGNAVITLAKLVAALLGGSVAMLAESVHSLADTANQALLLLGARLGKKTDPIRYPLGRAREVYFWAFVVAMMLFLLGGLFAVNEGVHKLLATQHPPSSPRLALAILGVSIVCEAISFRVAYREFLRQKGAQSLKHALFSGKDPTVPIVLLEDTGALLGLILAAVAVTLSWVTGKAWPDAVGSIVIGILLCVIGFLLALDTKSLLIGEAATPAMRQQALRVASTTPGVDAVTQMLTYHLGPETVLLALKVRFASGLSLSEVESVVDAIEARVRGEVPSMKRIFVEPDGDYAEIPTNGRLA